MGIVISNPVVPGSNPGGIATFKLSAPNRATLVQPNYIAPETAWLCRGPGFKSRRSRHFLP